MWHIEVGLEKLNPKECFHGILMLSSNLNCIAWSWDATAEGHPGPR